MTRPQSDMVITRFDMSHDRGRFDCGAEAENVFLESYAIRSSLLNLSRTWVAVDSLEPSRILGYYTLAMSNIDVASMVDRFGQTDIPGVLLERIAVDKEFQGHGIGGRLLVDALFRAYRASSEIAAYAVLAHADTDESREFFLHNGFIPFVDAEKYLFLPMKQIEHLILAGVR